MVSDSKSHSEILQTQKVLLFLCSSSLPRQLLQSQSQKAISVLWPREGLSIPLVRSLGPPILFCSGFDK